MTYLVEVYVLPLPELRDPQGQAVEGALKRLGFPVSGVRVGKVVRMQVEASSAAEAERLASEAARKLLANPVIEEFRVKVLEGADASEVESR